MSSWTLQWVHPHKGNQNNLRPDLQRKGGTLYWDSLTSLITGGPAPSHTPFTSLDFRISFFFPPESWCSVVQADLGPEYSSQLECSCGLVPSSVLCERSRGDESNCTDNAGIAASTPVPLGSFANLHGHLFSDKQKRQRILEPFVCPSFCFLLFLNYLTHGRHSVNSYQLMAINPEELVVSDVCVCGSLNWDTCLSYLSIVVIKTPWPRQLIKVFNWAYGFRGLESVMTGWCHGDRNNCKLTSKTAGRNQRTH